MQQILFLLLWRMPGVWGETRWAGTQTPDPCSTRLIETKKQFLIVPEDSMCLRRRQWQPTPALLPGKPHGWRSLIGYSPCGRKESDTTERLHFHFLPGELNIVTETGFIFFDWENFSDIEPSGGSTY